MSLASVEEARALFGERLVEPGAIAQALGDPAIEVPPLPFTKDELRGAASAGEVLIYRTSRAAQQPLSIVALSQHFPAAFDAKMLKASGYQLKDEWGIELEPLATTDTCHDGWALFQAEVLQESRNHTHPEGDGALRNYEQRLELAAGSVRRRTAIEAVYDLTLFFAVRSTRLLAESWDWTSSMTIDRGLLQVGGFGSRGMQIIGYSAGSRHGALGVCPTRQPRR